MLYLIMICHVNTGVVGICIRLSKFIIDVNQSNDLEKEVSREDKSVDQPWNQDRPMEWCFVIDHSKDLILREYSNRMFTIFSLKGMSNLVFFIAKSILKI